LEHRTFVKGISDNSHRFFETRHLTSYFETLMAQNMSQNEIPLARDGGAAYPRQLKFGNMFAI